METRIERISLETLGAVHTQSLLSVEEKEQKSKINKFNRDSGKSIKILCRFLLSFYVIKNYKNLRKIGVLICYE